MPGFVRQSFNLRQNVGSFLLVLTITTLSNVTHAEVALHEFESTVQESQYQGLIAEFRCPKCQNQNLAGSDAPIAVDLKERTYELVKQGQTDQQIRDYMISRYGDFISYKPPVRPSTWILWFLPFVLLVMAMIGWIMRVRRQKRHITPMPLSDAERHQLDTLLQRTSPTSKEHLQ